MANVGSQQNTKVKYFRSKYQLKHEAGLPIVGHILYNGNIHLLSNSPYLRDLTNLSEEEVEKHISQGYKFILVYVQKTSK